MKRLRCLFKPHAFPKNSIFETYGAVFKGGYCERCDRVIQGKFLYNAWGEEIDLGHVVELTGTNPQLTEDLASGKYVGPQ